MPFSYENYQPTNNTTDTFTIPFDYQDQSEISVTVDGVNQTGLTFPSATTVQLTAPVASGAAVQVRRTTDITTRAIDFQSGSVLTEEDLDTSNTQVFHAVQEASDKSNDGITLAGDDKWDAQSKVIKNVATPSANTDAATKAYVDSSITTATASTLASAQQAVTDAEGHRDDAETFKNQAAGFVSTAEDARDDAQAAQTAAETAETNAATSASQAQGYLAAASFPASLTGSAGEFLQVNTAETGYNLVASVASPQFYGFKNQADGTILHEYGKMNVNVDDYATYFIGENVEFAIENNNLVMRY